MSLLFDQNERLVIRAYYANNPKLKKSWTVDRFEISKALRDLKRDVKSEIKFYAGVISDHYRISSKNRMQINKSKTVAKEVLSTILGWVILIIGVLIGIFFINLLSSL